MEVKQLKDVCDISKGTQINGDELLETGFPFFNGGIKQSGYWKESNVPANSISISEGGNSCGFVNYQKEPFWCGAHCYYLYNLKLDSKYLYYNLKGRQNDLMNLRTGVCMPNIKKTDLQNFKIHIKDDKTQNEIVEVLDNINAVIDADKKQLELYDELIKSRFNEMFGDLVSKQENRKKIDDIAFVTKLAGFEFTQYIKYKTSGDIIMLRGLNCKNGKLVLDDIKWIDKATSNLLPRSQLSKGDILMTYAGTIADVAVVPEDNKFHLAPNVAKICINNKEEIDPIFLVNLFMMTKEYILSFASTVAQPSINMEKIRNFEYSIPAIKEQKMFASFVQQIDKSKFIVQKHLDLMNELLEKKMEEYFGGK